MFLELGVGDNRKTKSRVSQFRPNGATGVNGPLQVWQAEPDETMIYIVCVGGGGSGAGGFQGAAGAIRGGGGGGGAAGQTRALIPLMFLPKTLYIQPGQGGAGVAASTNGNSGNLSYVSVFPNVTAAANIVVQSGTAKASNTVATAGTGAAAGAGGSAETISTVALCMQGQWGILQFLAGKVGAAGGAVTGAAGAANTLFTTGCSNGGAGGGSTPAANTNFAGGAQTGPGSTPYVSIPGGVSGGNPGHGSGGYSFVFNQIVPYGGAGGATGGAAGQTAGDGGDGGFPGGGGGGGGGGVTGGRGGRGGDGCVWIISW